MVHDPSAETPRCRLQEEDSEEYGPPIVPETAVAAAIKSMTERHLAQTGGQHELFPNSESWRQLMQKHPGNLLQSCTAVRPVWSW